MSKLRRESINAYRGSPLFARTGQETPSFRLAVIEGTRAQAMQRRDDAAFDHNTIDFNDPGSRSIGMAGYYRDNGPLGDPAA